MDNEKDRLWQELDDKRRRGAERYRKIVAETELNMAFLCGNQWTWYNMAEGIEKIFNANNEELDVDNRIMPDYLRMMEELYGAEPAIVAYEGGIEVKDSMSAKCAVQICDYLNKNNGWEKARVRVGSWMMVCGTGYIMPFWKKNSRRVKRDRQVYVDEGVETENGVTHIMTKPVDEYDGDIAFEVLNPLNVYCYPLDADCWENVQEIMVVNLTSFESFERRYGRKMDKEKYEPVNGDTVNFEALSRINRYVSPEMGYAADMAATDTRYLEIQWFKRPTPDRKRGRYVLAFGGRILQDHDLPYVDVATAIDPGDNLNLTMGIIPQFSAIMPGMLHPPAPITTWRPAQIRINDLMNDVRANRKSFGRNKLIVEENAIDDDTWTDEHGQIVKLKPGSFSFTPQFIQAAPLAGINQELDRAEYALQQVTGQSAVTQGHNDTQVRSAMHFEMLKNSAATVNWMISAEAARCETETAKFVVQMVRDYWDNDRILDVVGRDRAIYCLAFRDAVLPTDIRFKRGSAMSRNYILREETLEKWLQYGLFGDAVSPDMRRKFMQATELGNLFDVTDIDAPHRNRANWENLQMALGNAIEPMADENHLVHIETHSAYLQSAEGRSSSEAVESILRGHIDYHRYLYSSQMEPGLDMEAQPIRGLGSIGLTSPGQYAMTQQASAQQSNPQQPNAQQ